MFKIISFVLKKIIIGMLLLFGYNLFLSSFNLMIPLNLITILIASLLDVPGVIGLVLFLNFNF
jgi:pro-sigmaK processing inhibitor BofA